MKPYRITRWLLIAIGVYSVLLVSFLNLVILNSDNVKDRAIFLLAAGMILLWIIVGGSLTPMLRRRLVPELAAIPIDWRVRFVIFCTAMALIEEVITTTMTNCASLLGTTPEEAQAIAAIGKSDHRAGWHCDSRSTIRTYGQRSVLVLLNVTTSVRAAPTTTPKTAKTAPTAGMLASIFIGLSYEATHGARIVLARSWLASGSLMNSSTTGSYFRFRFSHMQILAACTVVIARCIAPG